MLFSGRLSGWYSGRIEGRPRGSERGSEKARFGDGLNLRMDSQIGLGWLRRFS